MRINRRNFTAGWLVLSVGCLFLACSLIKRAAQYTSAAPGERTTTASDIYIRRDYNRIEYYFYKRYSCSYSYSVNGITYREHSKNEDCIRLGADQAMLADSGGPLPGSNVIVYYDPSDPSLSSLTEFSATSAWNYRNGVLLIGIWLLTLVYQVVLAANEQGKNQRIYVDDKGTVLDPGEIDYSLGSDGLFNKARKVERDYTAANGQAASAADSDHAHRLRELYLDVVKHIHPDRALNEPDRAVRERLMKDANGAFKRGDAETLRSVLEEYRSLVPAL